MVTKNKNTKTQKNVTATLPSSDTEKENNHPAPDTQETVTLPIKEKKERKPRISFRVKYDELKAYFVNVAGTENIGEITSKLLAITDLSVQAEALGKLALYIKLYSKAQKPPKEKIPLSKVEKKVFGTFRAWIESNPVDNVTFTDFSQYISSIDTKKIEKMERMYKNWKAKKTASK